MARGTEAPAQRDPDDIVADIERTRDHLALTIDQIIERAHPKNVVSRGVSSVRSHFVDETGSVRLEAVLPVAGAVAGVVALVVALRAFVRD